MYAMHLAREKWFEVSENVFFSSIEVASYPQIQALTDPVLGLLRACELLEPECLVQMLKAVKHLSMNATLHEVLQNANALEILIRILEEHTSGPQSAVCENDKHQKHII